MAMGEEEALPKIGDPCQGSFIKDIICETVDRGTRVRCSKITYLENGCMMTEHKYVEKNIIIEGEYHEDPYVRVAFPEALINRPPKKEKEVKAKKKKLTKEEKAAKFAQEEAEKAERRKKFEQEAQRKRQALLDKQNGAKKAAAEKEEEERKKQEAAAKAKQEQEEATAAAAAAAKLKLEEAAKAKAEAQRKQHEEEEERRRKKEEAEKPQAIIVYSENDPDRPQPNASSTTTPIGLWYLDLENSKHNDKDYQDNDCWKPQNVLLHAPGKEPENDDDIVGTWGYHSGTEPADDETNWRPTSGSTPVILLPPGAKAPKTFVDKGKYTLAASPTTTASKHHKHKPPKWPPPVDKLKKQQKEASKIKLPQAFQSPHWKPQMARVYPQAKVPTTPVTLKEDQGMIGTKPKLFNNHNHNKNGANSSHNDKSKSNDLVGVWTYNKENNKSTTTNNPEDDSRWKAMRVQIQKEKPIVSTKTFGVFAISKTAQPIPNNNGEGETWDPRDFHFLAPGEAPPDDCHPLGYWTAPPGKLNVKWPPEDAPTYQPPGMNSKNNNKNKKPWKVQKAIVYPKNAPRKDNDTKPRGVWKFRNHDEPKDLEDWAPQGILMYNGENENNNNIPQDEKVVGMWGLSPGAEPDENGNYQPDDLWFFGPGQEPDDDDDWNPMGTWTYDDTPNKSSVWPPKPKPNFLKGAGPKNAIVYPPGAVPKTAATDDKPRGVWRFKDGEDLDDDDWAPKGILMYHGNEEVPDDSGVVGVWGFKPGAEPDDDGNWNPKDLWFCGPGEEPDDDEWTPMGKWTYREEEKDPVWPPKPKPKFTPKGQADDWKVQNAVVYPSGALPENAAVDDKPRGIWRFKDGEDLDDDDWAPKGIIMYNGDEEVPDGSGVVGVWGFQPGAEPDDDGNWNPKDLWFCGPGEEPDDDEWTPMGKWTYRKEEKDPVWPPKPKPKFTPKGQADDWKVQNAIVYPSGALPENAAVDDKPRGIWRFKDGEDLGDDDWAPKGIIMYNGDEEVPEDSGVVGIWGFQPGAEPDDDGNWNPKDLWFCGPGEEPDDDEWTPMGKWTYREEEKDPVWPPKPKPKFTPKGQPDDWKVQNAVVYPPGAVLEPGDDKPCGIWRFKDGEDLEDDDWAPKGIIMYNGDEDVPDDSGVVGIWGFKPGAEPDDDGNWNPKDMWFCGPGEEPDDDEWTPMGKWTYREEEKDPVWPPKPKPKYTAKGQPDNWRVQDVWVYGPGAVAKGDTVTDKPPDGVWRFREGHTPEDLDEWAPKGLRMYNGDADVPDDSGVVGIWGLHPGAEPDDDGNWNPKDLWFCTPGEEPEEEDWEPLGKWTYRTEEKPKFKPKGAPDNWKVEDVVVYPPGAVANDDDTTAGIWRFNNSQNPDDLDEWAPQGLRMYNGDDVPDDSKVVGIWGLGPGAEPDDEGNWDPKDVWFFGPGEAPDDDDWNPCGKWTHPPGKIDTDWPPKTKNSSKEKKVPGKLKSHEKKTTKKVKPHGSHKTKPKDPAPSTPDHLPKARIAFAPKAPVTPPDSPTEELYRPYSVMSKWQNPFDYVAPEGERKSPIKSKKKVMVSPQTKKKQPKVPKKTRSTTKSHNKDAAKEKA